MTKWIEKAIAWLIAHPAAVEGVTKIVKGVMDAKKGKGK